MNPRNLSEAKSPELRASLDAMKRASDKDKTAAKRGPMPQFFPSPEEVAG